MKFRQNQLMTVLIVAPLVFLLQCTASNQDDYIVLKIQPQKPTDPIMIRIQVCNPEIIRVTATRQDAFSQHPSLITDRVWPTVKWSLKDEDLQYIISTSKMTIKVQKSGGRVAFFDLDGEPILQEIAEGGKVITPATVMNEPTYYIRQIFESAPDEAFYGLGQHQNDVMNYRGHDVDLWQYNIVVAVPFLVSNRNYGILWDNNSHTKFGDIRDYQSLSSLKLYDDKGQAGGLNAEYFEQPDFRSLFMSQSENRIEHEFIDVNDDYPAEFDINRGSIRWSGAIESDCAGVHKFRLYASSYIKVWLNNELVVDAWRQNWLPWTHLLKLDMQAGKRYPIKIEWIPNGGFIGLKYLPPETENYQNCISLWSQVADAIDYYFIYGENLDQVVSGYRQITGKATMLPKWAMGFWQCRERYKTQDELLNVVREFRRRRIPIDNIVQDWFYWPEDKWGDHDFDKTRFPDPAAMVRELHENLHTHIMISVWPKFYVGTENYEQLRKNGWLYMRNIEKGQRDWVGPGYVSTFYDPYRKKARDLYWRQINTKLYRKGFDAWWLDSTEPDLQSNLSREETILRIGPTAMGTAARYLNTYSLMNAKGVYENQRQTNPDRRVFILTRSAFAGQQRYAATTWSGDIAARWYDLKAQISAGLNFCLSGLPYWTTDIGGFAVEPRYEHPTNKDLDEWRELNTRWYQFAAFCPLFRSHGQYPYREIFNIAPDNHPAYQAMLKYDQLRYRLMPYIYSLAGLVTHEDYTIMRALVMDYASDKQVLNIGDQFMFGPAILVNPVTEYKARSRPVYLPHGNSWYELQSGQYYFGGQYIQAKAPYHDIPLFVKAGAIIPFGPEIQYSDEKPADPIRLYVYTGQDGNFRLYEDENINYNYEKGQFAIIPLVWNEPNRTLTIGKRQGSFSGMLENRIFQIVWITNQHPVPLDFDLHPDRVVDYNGEEISIAME